MNDELTMEQKHQARVFENETRIECMAIRQSAWLTASTLVNPIIEQHGLNRQIRGSIIATEHTFSEVDQHIDHVLRVADWLISPEE